MMSSTVVVVEGVVKPDGTLAVSEKVSLPAGRVQVIVQPLPDLTQDPFWQRMGAIWVGQQARGHVPRSSAEIEAERRAIRDEMEDEIQAAMRLQDECRRAREQAEQAARPAT